MNLLAPDACWIPVRLRPAGRTWVSLATLLADPDIVAIDSVRPDFAVALTQVAIAVLQTVATVDSRVQWRRRFERQPDAATIQTWFEPWLDAFQFDGDGPRIFQDLSLKPSEADEVAISQLLIDSPGDNAIRNHTDWWIKRGRVEALCPACAFTALATLQINAPSGGAGNRTGVRGGGPLTTLLQVDTGNPNRSLWHTLWANVLTGPELRAGNGDADLPERPHAFPWMAPIEKLQAAGGSLAPIQTHPLHVLWATPRRIRLDFDHAVAGTCDLCGRPSEGLVQRYLARPQGLNYKGPWRHGLSPYYRTPEQWLPMHPQPGGLGYRHWLGLVLGSADARQTIEPAAVVTQHLRLVEDSGVEHAELRLWASGYDMDNAKARGWHEALMPLFRLPEADEPLRNKLRDEVGGLIAGASLVASYLRSAVKDAWFSSDARGDFSHIDAVFWDQTEEPFYRLLGQAVDTLASADAQAARARRERWRGQLAEVATNAFEHEFVGAGAIERQNMRRVAKARDALQAKLAGPKLRQVLGLPVEETPTTTKRRRGAVVAAGSPGAPDV